MPRPITKEDIKKGRKKHGWTAAWEIRKDKNLGIYLYDSTDYAYAYACEILLTTACPRWITKKQFIRKQKLGHSTKPRKKYVRQIMREPDFGLDEMAIAERIINDIA